jgi:hypothetical protein
VSSSEPPRYHLSPWLNPKQSSISIHLTAEVITREMSPKRTYAFHPLCMSGLSIVILFSVSFKFSSPEPTVTQQCFRHLPPSSCHWFVPRLAQLAVPCLSSLSHSYFTDYFHPSSPSRCLFHASRCPAARISPLVIR